MYSPNPSSPTRLIQPLRVPRRASPIATLDSAPAIDRRNLDASRNGTASSATSNTIVSPIVTTTDSGLSLLTMQPPRALSTLTLPTLAVHERFHCRPLQAGSLRPVWAWSGPLRPLRSCVPYSPLAECVDARLTTGPHRSAGSLSQAF